VVRQLVGRQRRPDRLVDENEEQGVAERAGVLEPLEAVGVPTATCSTPTPPTSPPPKRGRARPRCCRQSPPKARASAGATPACPGRRRPARSAESTSFEGSPGDFGQPSDEQVTQ
jgi:hypothetical protein